MVVGKGKKVCCNHTKQWNCLDIHFYSVSMWATKGASKGSLYFLGNSQCKRSGCAPYFFLLFFFPPSLPYWSGWTKVRSLQIALDYWDSLSQIDIFSRLEAPPISQISPHSYKPHTKHTLSPSLPLSLCVSLPLFRISALTSRALIWMGFQISFYGSPIYFICYLLASGQNRNFCINSHNLTTRIHVSSLLINFFWATICF